MTTTLATISIGANLGRPQDAIRSAFAALAALSRRPLKRSSLWRASPVDCPPGSPDFVNAAAALWPHPDETPETLLAKLQGLEKALGRAPKTIMNEPRRIDLDLITFGDAIRKTASLTLPHPRADRRLFVLKPLAEVAPTLRFSREGPTVRQLADTLATTETVSKLT